MHSGNLLELSQIYPFIHLIINRWLSNFLYNISINTFSHFNLCFPKIVHVYNKLSGIYLSIFIKSTRIIII